MALDPVCGRWEAGAKPDGRRSLTVVVVLGAVGSLVPGTSWADDGLLAPLGSGGPLYSELEHADVRLVEETIEIRRLPSRRAARVRVMLGFENQARVPVRARCGFPIRSELEITREGGGWVLGMPLAPELREPLGIDPSKPEKLARMELPLRKRLELPFPGPDGRSAGFPSAPRLLLDAEAVPLDEVVLEVDREPHTLVVETHYLHELVLAPGRSTLVVEYDHDDTTQSYGGLEETRRLPYVLGTGHTWKGPIDRIALSLPRGEPAELPSAFTYVTTFGGQDIYEAGPYEPETEHRIVLAGRHFDVASFLQLEGLWKALMTEGRLDWDRIPALSRARTPAASWVNALPGPHLTTKTWVGVAPTILPYASSYGFLPRKRLVDFSPRAAFDNLDESAWCEGDEGDGVGTALAFRLARPVSAVEILIGFRKLDGILRRMTKRNPFEENGRPRVLEIRRLEGPGDGALMKTLSLADRVDPQRLDLALPAGDYSMTIRAVFRGATFRDTCIGEVRFLPDDPLIDRLLAR